MHHTTCYLGFYFKFNAQSVKLGIDPQHNIAFVTIADTQRFHPFIRKA